MQMLLVTMACSSRGDVYQLLQAFETLCLETSNDSSYLLLCRLDLEHENAELVRVRILARHAKNVVFGKVSRAVHLVDVLAASYWT